MRSITRGLLALAVLIGPAVGVAHAITIKEIVQYKSLGPKILISLIEADRSVFHLTAEDVSKLKEQGVDESVILAMIETAKPKSERKIVELPDQPDQPVPPIEPPPDLNATTADAPPAPVVVNVTQQVSQHVDASPATVEVPVPVAVPVIEHGRRPLPEPRQAQSQAPSQQYWGYGGQKRPDSWGPPSAPPPPHSDTKPDPSKGGGS